jgi:flagellar basal-body rod protein FlgC
MESVIRIATSGLVANRTQLDVIAGNIAMKDVTRDESGRPIPYRRRVALLAPGDVSGGADGPGVHVARIVEDPTPFGLRWDPQHPDAVPSGPEQGYVRISNVDVHAEMVNAMTAMRAYEANVTVIEMAKSMAASTLRLIA